MATGYTGKDFLTQLSSLLRGAGTNQSDGFDFLASCTGLDVAGIDHSKASSWLKQAKKETDSAGCSPQGR
ncbi:hypothetical protein TNCT6_28710 [Streptomyces sp. 6-11-2]|nr:hypothetical protein TNCT6_28710 [Streptomyces sp. 6-11-2]